MMHIAIFISHDTSTFKTKALRLANVEGRVKHLLRVWLQLIQPYLRFLWLLLAMHFVSKGTPIDDIDDKNHKT